MYTADKRWPLRVKVFSFFCSARGTVSKIFAFFSELSYCRPRCWNNDIWTFFGTWDWCFFFLQINIFSIAMFSIAFIAWLARQKLNILTSQPYIPSCKHASRSMRARVLSIVSCFIKFNLSIIKKFLLATSSGGNNFLNRNSNKQETVCKKLSFCTVLGRTYTSSESITLSLFRSHCSKEVWESSSSMEWW